ncbi:hypothetical protein MAPG_00177 [Magnaporthiopsis poae ATCC 64411]|uniref:Uncharacterized protein n=1 Tax=Magnaporthiopsis poae (strain ATCC 64411 / 73-15) TaxID=644358 RepID=A0A0C4DKB1_MAGP6|nr:hypothetical protein MAPG_00177 [Magnaporthiopsis poae ATCC 64411]
MVVNIIPKGSAGIRRRLTLDIPRHIFELRLVRCVRTYGVVKATARVDIIKKFGENPPGIPIIPSPKKQAVLQAVRMDQELRYVVRVGGQEVERKVFSPVHHSGYDWTAA